MTPAITDKDRRDAQRELTAIARGLHYETPIAVPAGHYLDLVREVERSRAAASAIESYEARVRAVTRRPTPVVAALPVEATEQLPRVRVYLRCQGCARQFPDQVVNIEGMCPACRGSDSGVPA